MRKFHPRCLRNVLPLRIDYLDWSPQSSNYIVELGSEIRDMAMSLILIQTLLRVVGGCRPFPSTGFASSVTFKDLNTAITVIGQRADKLIDGSGSDPCGPPRIEIKFVGQG